MAIAEKRKFKTKKVLSGVRTEYRAWKEWSEGEVLIFKLLGSSPNRKNKSKKDWLVEVIEPQFEDKAENKRLKPGTRLTLNSAGQFDKGMEQLEFGAIAQVTYNGSKEMTGGEYEGQMAHTMEVEELCEEGDEDEGEQEGDGAEDSDYDF